MSILTFTQIKEVTGLAKIVDESRKITPFLTQAEKELKKMLGTTMYAELQAAVTGAFAGEADLSTLFTSYLKAPLAWRTLQYALPRMYSEPTANGIHAVSDANYNPVDSRTLAMQVAQARDFADGGYDEMLRYINDNLDLFPTFITNVDSEERVTRTYTGGVITRKSRWQYPYGIKHSGYRGDRRNLNDPCCDD